MASAHVASVKVSTKHQIVVPSEARHRLGIEAGDRLDVAVTETSIVITKAPARPADRLRDLGRDIWTGIDPVEYSRELRREWDDRIPR